MERAMLRKIVGLVGIYGSGFYTFYVVTLECGHTATARHSTGRTRCRDCGAASRPTPTGETDAGA
jgi:hypothetical protein